MLGTTGSGRADSTGPGLNWVRLPGAEQCLGWKELAARVEARLDATLFQRPTDAELSLDGYVAPREGGGFAARLAVIDAQGEVLGERTLESKEPSCRALDDAIVLVIAVTLDPDSRLLDAGIPLAREVSDRLDRLFRGERDQLAPSDAPVAHRADLSEREESARTPAVAERHRAPAPAEVQPGVSPWAIVALGVGEVGMLPGVAPGLCARVAWRPGETVSLELHGHWLAPREAEAPGGEPGRLTARAVGGGVAACFGRALGATHVRLCPGLRLDVVRVEPAGFAVDQGGRNDPWGSGQLGAILRFPRESKLFAEAGMFLLVPLVARDYQVLDSAGDEHTVLAPGPVAGRLEIGVGFRP